MIHSRSCRIALTIVVLSAIQGRVGHAQFSLNMGDPVANQKKAFEGKMTVLLEELGRVCELSDEQKLKLQTARKGAITRAMKLWKKEALAAQARFGGAIAAIPAIGNDETEEKEDEDEEEKISPQTVLMLSSMGVQTDPSKIVFWTRTVKKVLTDEQKSKLAVAESARRKFRRELGVRQKVQELDQRLRFSPDQRQKVMDVIDRVLGPTMETEPQSGASFVLIGDFPELSVSQLKPVLAPEQIEVFRQYLVDQRNPMAAALQVARPRRMRMPQVAGMNESIYLGIALTMNPLNPNTSKVHVVLPDGPAEKAGLEAGDEIVSVGGDPIGSPAQLFTTASGKEPGDKLELVVKRDGEELELEIVIGKRVD